MAAQREFNLEEAGKPQSSLIAHQYRWKTERDVNDKFADIDSAFTPSAHMLNFQHKMVNKAAHNAPVCKLSPPKQYPTTPPTIVPTTPPPYSYVIDEEFGKGASLKSETSPEIDSIIDEEINKSKDEHLVEGFTAQYYQTSCITLAFMFVLITIIFLCVMSEKK